MARVRQNPPAASAGAPSETPAKAAALPAVRPKASGSAKRKKPPMAVTMASSGAGGQVALIAGIAVSAFTGVALFSYDPHDVSLSVAGTGQTENLVGPAGSYLADLLYQGFGYAAWCVLLLGVAWALRLAGRPSRGWVARILGAIGFVLLATGLQLALAASLDGPFEPGGLVGHFLSQALTDKLGRIGAGLIVATGLVTVATILFRIDWQPLAARAVDRVQQGAPAAVRGVGALGVGAVRASLRGASAGIEALRDRAAPRDDDEDYEDDDALDEVDAPSRAGTPSAPGIAAAAPAAEGPAPTGALVRRAPDPAPRRAPEPVARRAEPRRLPEAEAGPELPSVWSARKAPPAPPVRVLEGDPDRDVPTKVSGRSLVEVEWEGTSSTRRAEIDPPSGGPLPPHLRGATPAPITPVARRPVDRSAEPRVQETRPVERRPPATDGAPWLAEAPPATGRSAPAPSPAPARTSGAAPADEPPRIVRAVSPEPVAPVRAEPPLAPIVSAARGTDPRLVRIPDLLDEDEDIDADEPIRPSQVEWADEPEPVAPVFASARAEAPRAEPAHVEPAPSPYQPIILAPPEPTPAPAASRAPASARTPAPAPAAAPAAWEDEPDSAADAVAEDDVVDAIAPPPPAPNRVVASSGPARVAPTGRRPRPSGDGVTVLPGNLKSGGAGGDGRAVRVTNAPFQLPPLSLLDDHPAIIAGTDEGVLHDMARRLTETLRDFQVDGRVTAIRPGPVITMFEYEPAAGVKLSRIANLADNLKMALKAISVRIVAPLPGRGCVGIEIPNEKRQTVWARDVFSSPEFKNVERSLPMILGKDTEGRPFVTDLAKMPHLLVGGTTGSGKSVGVNSMLTSMLFMRTPEELRMILIDPKMLEFALYEDIPHLLHPVVTEPKFASAVLKWACTEMDERYKIMARWQTRHIDTYNQKVTKELEDWTPAKARAYAPKDWPDGELLPIPKKFPYIVIVIDELADLMMVASSDVEASISRIVAKARAAGIHLIVATQTPRRDVITGLIKANMPASLAYQVRSGLDSRVILDQNGAETLLGKGDLLFLRPGTSDLVRIHAPFLSEDEVHRVADHLRAQAPPEYDLRIGSGGGDGEDGDEPEGEYDELYDEAVELAIGKGKISTSMLQRHLGIGYNRAANIVETMEREGVVGPADGARPREVLVGQA